MNFELWDADTSKNWTFLWCGAAPSYGFVRCVFVQKKIKQCRAMSHVVVRFFGGGQKLAILEDNIKSKDRQKKDRAPKKWEARPSRYFFF